MLWRRRLAALHCPGVAAFVVQSQPTPGQAPLALGFVSGRCKLALSTRRARTKLAHRGVGAAGASISTAAQLFWREALDQPERSPVDSR